MLECPRSQSLDLIPVCASPLAIQSTHMALNTLSVSKTSNCLVGSGLDLSSKHKLVCWTTYLISLLAYQRDLKLDMSEVWYFPKTSFFHLFTYHIQPTRKPCWLYLQNISRFCPRLGTSTCNTPVQAAVISHLDYFNNFSLPFSPPPPPPSVLHRTTQQPEWSCYYLSNHITPCSEPFHDSQSLKAECDSPPTPWEHSSLISSPITLLLSLL